MILNWRPTEKRIFWVSHKNPPPVSCIHAFHSQIKEQNSKGKLGSSEFYICDHVFMHSSSSKPIIKNST